MIKDFKQRLVDFDKDETRRDAVRILLGRPTSYRRSVSKWLLETRKLDAANSLSLQRG